VIQILAPTELGLNINILRCGLCLAPTQMAWPIYWLAFLLAATDRQPCLQHHLSHLPSCTLWLFYRPSTIRYIPCL